MADFQRITATNEQEFIGQGALDAAMSVYSEAMELVLTSG